MRVVETVAALQVQAVAWRRAGESVGLVPTMGALHDGHIGLVRAAQQDNDRVVVSVFVNPKQFNEKSDLDAYPRDFEADAQVLADAGVDAVFHPPVEEMYPAGLTATRVRPGRVADLYEGEQRPGHFEGVASVVARLFKAGLPDRAYFGRKDAQQLAVIRAMVRDLGFPITVVGCPTARDADGLAMSSRNARLSPEARRSALALVRSLAEAQRAFAGGDRDAAGIAGGIAASLQRAPWGRSRIRRGGRSQHLPAARDRVAASLAILAVRVGAVRLIDNAELGAGDLFQYATEMPPASHGVPA